MQALKKMERSLKEFEMQAEETSQSLERQMEQITSLSGRNKQLKSQFADSVSHGSGRCFDLSNYSTYVQSEYTSTHSIWSNSFCSLYRFMSLIRVELWN